MRILVTGGHGFLGGHLVDLLRREGEDPVVASRRDGDLLDAGETEQLFERTHPELVFHLAAEVGGIGANRKHPGRYWYANLLMGANVLEQSRRAGVQKLVLVGTVCSYPKLTSVPFRERDLWNGYPEETNAAYGVAKKALLVGADAYRVEYGLNAISLLPANLYGPRDNFDLETSHVVPALIRKMIEARTVGDAEIVLWGDGTPTREFLFVEDCARALWLAAGQYSDAEPVNIGTGEEVSIADLATTIARLVGFEGAVSWDSSRPNGQPRRALEVSRAAAAFDFRARVSLEDGLRRTIDWAQDQDLFGKRPS